MDETLAEEWSRPSITECAKNKGTELGDTAVMYLTRVQTTSGDESGGHRDFWAVDPEGRVLGMAQCGKVPRRAHPVRVQSRKKVPQDQVPVRIRIRRVSPREIGVTFSA